MAEQTLHQSMRTIQDRRIDQILASLKAEHQAEASGQPIHPALQHSPSAPETVQRQTGGNGVDHAAQYGEPGRENRTGMPDNLKSDRSFFRCRDPGACHEQCHRRS